VGCPLASFHHSPPAEYPGYGLLPLFPFEGGFRHVSETAQKPQMDVFSGFFC